MVKSYVTRSGYYVTHLGVHIGFMQYDGTSCVIRLCMLRIDLGITSAARDSLVEISRAYKTQVMQRMADFLEFHNIGYDLCIREITQDDLAHLSAGRKVPSHVRAAARTYISERKGSVHDEAYMKEFTRRPFMDVIYLYYLGM